jgi:hypothetical protein
MCTAMYIDDERIETQGELAAAIGAENIVCYGPFRSDAEGYTGPNTEVHAKYSETDAEHCCCGVDFVETAAKIGRYVEMDEYGDAVFVAPTGIKREPKDDG